MYLIICTVTGVVYNVSFFHLSLVFSKISTVYHVTALRPFEAVYIMKVLFFFSHSVLKNLHCISFHHTAVYIVPIHFHQLHPDMQRFFLPKIEKCQKVKFSGTEAQILVPTKHKSHASIHILHFGSGGKISEQNSWRRSAGLLLYA